MDNIDSYSEYELTQEEFFNLSKSDRIISFFKTSREILKNLKVVENDNILNSNFVFRKTERQINLLSKFICK